MSNNSDIEVTFEEVQNLTTSKDALIIDVREPDELAGGKNIPGSINIPLARVEAALKTMSPEEFQGKYNRAKPSLDFPVVFSCARGGRALKAQQLGIQLGFKNVKYYKGSWTEWEQKLKEV